ncbi:putative methyltransferase [Amylocarpus encephaloides]|uniref:Methyltransferase n=1 Tax=Amylocarpus encephaloides TaxID=45428 RepID=A0A9P7YEV5_9HELO|nr:putative methyltransferase [Amylocarpus encephaloides]
MAEQNVSAPVPQPAETATQPEVAAASAAQVGETPTHEDIEADDHDVLEGDSAFGDDESERDSRTSLTSGITKYREENGRRYHAYRDGKYLIPNDEVEQDRLDLHHHVFNLALGGKLINAPIGQTSRVLDAGTGTGIWAIDFADQYPEAHIIGCDLSPIQPGWVPSNLEFEVDDIEDTWRHKPFTFIHMRSLAGSIRDWQQLLASIFNNLEPGGWLECVEFEVLLRIQNEDSIEFPPYIKKWQEGLHEAGEKFGRSFEVAVHLKDWLQAAGFVGVTEDIIKVPNSPWPRDRRRKEMGLYQQQNMFDASSSYGQAHFTRILGWTSQEFDIMSAQVRKELRDLRYHSYSNLYVVYGQKPGGGKEEVEVEIEKGPAAETEPGEGKGKAAAV